jgi:hypothetical protein
MRRVLPLFLVLLAASPAAAQRYINPNKVAEPQRPAALVPLYLSQLTLHGLDVHSTKEALERGHREANPYFKDATNNEMIAAKAAVSVGTMWLSEKLWKKNRVAAVAVMATVNVALGAVVANNYRIAYQTGPRGTRRTPGT